MRINIAIHWQVVCLISCLCFFGCKNKPVSENDSDSETNSASYVEEYLVSHVPMQYYDFDKVDDLSVFFDSISQKHEIPLRDVDSDGHQNDKLYECIQRIDGYRKGKNKYYPDSLVRRCIRALGFETSHWDSHGDNVDLGYTEWFLMCAAFYSPDISYLVHMQSPNHKVGVLNLNWGSLIYPCWAYVVLKRDKGYEVRRLRDDYTGIEKVFQLEDKENRTYYLLSYNNNEEYRDEYENFLQMLLYEETPNNYSIVAQCDSLPINPNVSFDKIYYNPDKKAWYCCNLNKTTGKLIPVLDNPCLELRLEGEHSEFIAPKAAN